MTDKSRTPRTDAFANERLAGPAQSARQRTNIEWIIFTRQLETELQAAREEARRNAEDAGRYRVKKQMDFSKYCRRRPFTTQVDNGEKIAWGITYDAAIDRALQDSGDSSP